MPKSTISLQNHTALPLKLSMCLLISMAGCQANNYTERGTALGGLTGAGIGALVGEATADRPLAGAAIGGALGAFSGASVGSGLDDIDRKVDAQVQQAAYVEPSRTTLHEVISMSDAGLSDQVISRHIHSHGFAGPLDAADLIALRQQGVSDSVISSLQDATSIRTRETVAMNRAPVIVEETYEAIPIPIPPPWRRRCPPYVRQPGVHWGVSFGN